MKWCNFYAPLAAPVAYAYPEMSTQRGALPAGLACTWAYSSSASLVSRALFVVTGLLFCLPLAALTFATIITLGLAFMIFDSGSFSPLDLTSVLVSAFWLGVFTVILGLLPRLTAVNQVPRQVLYVALTCMLIPLSMLVMEFASKRRIYALISEPAELLTLLLVWLVSLVCGIYAIAVTAARLPDDFIALPNMPKVQLAQVLLQWVLLVVFCADDYNLSFGSSLELSSSMVVLGVLFAAFPCSLIAYSLRRRIYLMRVGSGASTDHV